jgi:hypothetical protein
VSTAEKTHTTCDRCGYGIPFVHDLTEAERRLAEHFLAETYNGHGEPTRRSYPPAPVEQMLRDDPHYMLCQAAIRDARRLLKAFPEFGGVTTSEWGFRDHSGDPFVVGDASSAADVVAYLAPFDYHGTAVVRRERTRFDDHLSEWTDVSPPPVSGGTGAEQDDAVRALQREDRPLCRDAAAPLSLTVRGDRRLAGGSIPDASRDSVYSAIEALARDVERTGVGATANDLRAVLELSTPPESQDERVCLPPEKSTGGDR